MTDRDSKTKRGNFCGRTRRLFLWEIVGGFTGVALAALLGEDGFLARQALAEDGKTREQNPMAPKPPHSTAKEKSVIYLNKYGRTSHIDTFDYKPGMKGMD